MGWNKPAGAAPTAPKKKPNVFRGLIAGLVVVALAAIAYFTFLSGNATAPEAKAEKKPAAIKEVKPAAAPKVEWENPAEDLEAERLKRRELFKKMSPDERLAYLQAKIAAHPLRDEPSSNRIFSTGVEQVMDWVFSRELGDPPPMLPPMTAFDRAHLAEILIRDNPIRETDSERAKLAKETVQVAKKEFREFIRQGGDPDDFLPYYHGQLVAAHQERQMAQKSVFEILRNDPDLAPEYVQKVNEGLEAKGIKKVSIPKKLQEKYGFHLDE